MKNRYIQLAKSAAPYTVIAGSLLVGLAWLAPPVRMVAFDFAARMDLLTAQVGLNDPADAVASHACLNVLNSERPKNDTQILERLDGRPDIALACFGILDARHIQAEGEDAASQDGHSEDGIPEDASAEEHMAPTRTALVPYYQIAAAELGARWMQQLQSGESESCARAQDARLSLEYSRQDPTPALLTCAISSPSSQARQCCVEELGGEQAFEELLDAPERYVLPDGLRTYATLVEATFPLGEAKGEQPQPAGASQHAVQDWVIRVGCDLPGRTSNRTDLIATFAPLIESPLCAGKKSDALKAGHYRPKNWTATCNHLYDDQRLNHAQPPTRALCNALESATTQEAITHANFTLFAALSASTRTPGVERSAPQYPVLDIAQSKRRRRSGFKKSKYRSASSSRSPMLSAFFHGLIRH